MGSAIPPPGEAQGAEHRAQGGASWLPSPEGAERQKMIRGIILAKEPACRAG